MTTTADHASTLVAGICALGLALSAPAGAADLRMPMKAVPPVPVFSWAGFYAGAAVGYAWGIDSTTEYLTGTNIFTGFAWNYHANSLVGGAFAGGNLQFGNIVLGLEADLEAARTSGGFYDPPGVGTTLIDAQGSFRGRVGYAFDKTLFYGTAGLALANIGHTYTSTTSGISETTSGVRTGWTAGGGVEVAVTNHVLVRAEYRRADYGSYRYDSLTAFPGLTGEQRPRIDTVRVGVAYKF